MEKKSLKLNFLMNALLTMSSFIFPLISFPYISRILLPLGTGKVAFATSFIAYFSMFAQLGIPIYGIRICAQVRDDKEKLTRTAQELLIINLITSLISYTVLIIMLITIPKLREEKTLLIVVSLTIILTTIGVEWLYKALEKYVYITMRSIIFKFIALVGMFLLIHKQSDYVVYGGITLFAASASNFLNFINAHKYISLKPIGNYNFKRHIKPILVFFAMSCAVTIYTNLDTVMLGFMKGDVDVGYYSASIKIKSVLVSLITSLGAVLLPRASYYVERNMMEEFKRVTQKALSFVIAVSVPMMVYFILFAKEGIHFLSGDAYNPSILPMQILMPVLLFIGISNIMGIQILVPLGKEKVVLYSVIVGACVNILINTILIPRLASVGAAIGTVIAELVVLLVQYVSQKKRMKETFKNIQYIKIVIAVMVGVLVSFWVKNLNLGNFVTLLISSFLFFVSYFLTLLLLKEDTVIGIWKSLSSKLVK